MNERFTGEIMELPFECHYCKCSRMDFFMMDGDGKPMCEKCFEGFVKCVTGEEKVPR